MLPLYCLFLLLLCMLGTQETAVLCTRNPARFAVLEKKEEKKYNDGNSAILWVSQFGDEGFV